MKITNQQYLHQLFKELEDQVPPVAAGYFFICTDKTQYMLEKDIYILKKLAKSIPSPSGRSIRPICFIFFLNERYLCTDKAPSIGFHLPMTLLKFYSNAS